MKSNLKVSIDNFNAVAFFVGLFRWWLMRSMQFFAIHVSRYTVLIVLWRKQIKSDISCGLFHSPVNNYEKQQWKVDPAEILEIPVNLSSTNSPQLWLATSHNHGLGSLYRGKDLRGLPEGEIMFHRDFNWLMVFTLTLKAIKKNLRASDCHKWHRSFSSTPLKSLYNLLYHWAMHTIKAKGEG